MDTVQTYTIIVAVLIVVVLIALIYMFYSQVSQKKVTVVANLASDGSGTVTLSAFDSNKTSITVTLTVAANSSNSCSSGANGVSTMLDTVEYTSSTTTLNIKVKSTKYTVVLANSSLQTAPVVVGNKSKFNRSHVVIKKGSVTFGNKKNSIQLQGA